MRQEQPMTKRPLPLLLALGVGIALMFLFGAFGLPH